MLTPREKSPLPEKILLSGGIEPTTLHQAGLQAQHTTNQLSWPLAEFNTAYNKGRHEYFAHNVQHQSFYHADIQTDGQNPGSQLAGQT